MQDTAIVLILVLVAVLVWRGPKTLPQLGAMLGRGVKSARKQLDENRSRTDGDKPAS